MSSKEGMVDGGRGVGCGEGIRASLILVMGYGTEAEGALRQTRAEWWWMVGCWCLRYLAARVSNSFNRAAVIGRVPA